MCHALIIDDNMSVGRGVVDQLAAQGFDSFDHAWTGQQANAAAAQRPPDLVVIGETIADGSPLELARRISEVHGAPILKIASVGFRLHRPISDGQSRTRPSHLSEIEDAIALCRRISSWGGQMSDSIDAAPMASAAALAG